MTQAQVGALVGVSQARIAEIEANPGAVSLEKLMQLLSALGVTMLLSEAPLVSAATENKQSEVVESVGLTVGRNAAEDKEQIDRSAKANSTAEEMPDALEANKLAEQMRKVHQLSGAVEHIRQVGAAYKLAEQMRHLTSHLKKGSW